MNISIQNLSPRLFAIVLSLWMTVALASPLAAAQGSAPQPLKKIVVGYSAVSPSQAPGWMAYEAGFFRKYGLDVQLIFVESGSRIVQTLISGDVAAAAVAGAAVVQSNLQGSGIVMIAGFLNTMDYKFMVSRDITRPDQLKGKTVAVSRVGSSSDFATRYALEKYGLAPDKDVAILQIGSQPARFAALETGRIHGVMIAIPLTAKAARAGFNTLADLQMLGLEYQHTGLAVSQNIINTQPELVSNLLKAYIEAIHYMKTHRKETIAVLAKYLKVDDTDALQEAYEAVVQALIPEKPYPTLKGIQIMLRELGIKDAAARSARPEQFANLSLMKELDSSGFIDRLYKSSAVVKAPSRIDTQPAAAPTAKERAPVAEAKVKTASSDEKAKPAAPQPAASEQPHNPQSIAKTVNTGAVTAQQYIVKAGDTLTKIAERFYASAFKWEKIYEANRDVVKNPNYIYIGMKLTIPSDEHAG